jgi:hypothetical protein
MSLAIQELLPKLVDSLVSLQIHTDALASLMRTPSVGFSRTADLPEQPLATSGPLGLAASTVEVLTRGLIGKSPSGKRQRPARPPAKNSKASTRKGAKGARTGVGSRRRSSSEEAIVHRPAWPPPALFPLRKKAE